jgi:hypothetical protein
MTHRVVTFTLAHADGDSVLARVKSLPGVVSVGRISPNSRHELGRRMAFAHVAPAEKPETVRDAIASIQGVESADVPADRYAQNVPR